MTENTVLNSQTVPVSKLKFSVYNPRKMSEEEMEKLKKSIQKFGFISPVVTDKNFQIIGGHQRVTAAVSLGITSVPAVVMDISPHDAKILNVALNRIQGEWDQSKLRDLLKELQDDGDFEEMLLTGFDAVEMDDIMAAQDDVPDVDGADDEMPAVDFDAPAKTKIGDIYRLGEHLLVCGDSTDKRAMLAILGKGNRAQMVFTDPPYNVDYQGGQAVAKNKKRQKIANDKMSKQNFSAFLGRVCATIMDSCDGPVYCCMSSTELDTLKTNFEKSGGHFSCFIIWVKNKFILSRSDYHQQYEPILYGWPDRVKNHYFSGKRNIANVWQQKGISVEETEDGRYRISFDDPAQKRHVSVVVSDLEDCDISDKSLADVWNEDKPVKNKIHPTMKPVELCARGIRNSSKQGDIVLDLFAGSGSTMIACQKLGRKARLIELSPHYCDAICQRFEEFTGEKTELVGQNFDIIPPKGNKVQKKALTGKK